MGKRKIIREADKEQETRAGLNLEEPTAKAELTESSLRWKTWKEFDCQNLIKLVREV